MRKLLYKPIEIGDKFGQLEVVRYDGKHKDGRHYWYCKCSCNGNIKSYKKENLNNGNTTSCGCLKHKNNLNNNKDYTGQKNQYGTELIHKVKQDKNFTWIWKCKCGFCGNLFEEIPSKILNNHTKSCGCLKTQNAYMKNQKIKYSFYNWCIDNNKQEYLNFWDYELNNKTPKEVSYGSTIKRWFKCCNEVSNHKSQLHSLSHITNRGTPLYCVTCNSFAYWGINKYGTDFLDKYWDYDKNLGIDPFVISYACNKKVWIKCQEKDYHDSYLIACNKFSVSNCRCYYCKTNSGKIHPNDSLGSLYPQVLNIWSELNNKTPFEYAPHTNKKVWFKCQKHYDYKQSVNNAVERMFRCPECTKEMFDSYLQTKVYNYLLTKYPNYKINKEFKCTLISINPKTNYKLPYDNEIEELKLIIEVMGIQHYKPTSWIKNASNKSNQTIEELFAYQKWKDLYKKDFALKNGYNYIAIPYWTEKDESYKILIDNKIKEIKNNN